MIVDLSYTVVYNTQYFYQVLFVFVDPAFACLHHVDVGCVTHIFEEHTDDGGNTAHFHTVQTPKSRISINNESP
jgi:hypothetical protein